MTLQSLLQLSPFCQPRKKKISSIPLTAVSACFIVVASAPICSAASYIDVDGDGILDEVIHPGEDGFTVTVDSWNTYCYDYTWYPINSYWATSSFYWPEFGVSSNNREMWDIDWFWDYGYSSYAWCDTYVDGKISFTPDPGEQYALFEDMSGIPNVYLSGLWPHIGWTSSDNPVIYYPGMRHIIDWVNAVWWLVKRGKPETYDGSNPCSPPVPQESGGHAYPNINTPTRNVGYIGPYGPGEMYVQMTRTYYPGVLSNVKYSKLFEPDGGVRASSACGQQINTINRSPEGWSGVSFGLSIPLPFGAAAGLSASWSFGGDTYILFDGADAAAEPNRYKFGQAYKEFHRLDSGSYTAPYEDYNHYWQTYTPGNVTNAATTITADPELFGYTYRVCSMYCE